MAAAMSNLSMGVLGTGTGHNIILLEKKNAKTHDVP
jgi:hypothetical protein